MRKILFTCATLFAFSNLTFAEGGTVGIEDLSVLRTSPSCDIEQQETYDDAISSGATHYQAYFEAARVWGECMGMATFG